MATIGEQAPHQLADVLFVVDDENPSSRPIGRYGRGWWRAGLETGGAAELVGEHLDARDLVAELPEFARRKRRCGRGLFELLIDDDRQRPSRLDAVALGPFSQSFGACGAYPFE